MLSRGYRLQPSIVFLFRSKKTKDDKAQGGVWLSRLRPGVQFLEPQGKNPKINPGPKCFQRLLAKEIQSSLTASQLFSPSISNLPVSTLNSTVWTTS